MLRGCTRTFIAQLMKRSHSGSPIISPAAMNAKIKLEPAEEQLTLLLHEASQNAAFSDPDVVIRYAGGWVRDKILQKPSHDVDIAISSLSGHEFAVQFAKYLTTHHPSLKTGTITKILANPEKSKHLDTATSRFLSLELDFVQLRTESYGQQDSRTPDVVGVGTLEEDAERRDCTMNALYYNVHTRSIEDPTHRGLSDLARGCITTPMAPKKTFLDDPLRVLRCIRFASQFGFDIDAATFDEMKTPEVRRALKDKVVKERVGIEVLKMMKGIDPFKAVQALYTRRLYQIVFCNAEPEDDAAKDDLDWRVVEKAHQVLATHDALAQHLHEYRADGRLWLILSFLPYRHKLQNSPKKKDTLEPFACSIIRDFLKLTGAHETLVKSVFPPRSIDVSLESTPLELGKYVRLLSRHWKLALFVAHLDADVDADTQHTSPDSLVALMDKIEALGLDSAWSMTPFIDGKKIKTLLLQHAANIKVMKELMELLVEYKIEDAQVTEEQALARLDTYLANRQVNAEGW